MYNMPILPVVNKNGPVIEARIMRSFNKITTFLDSLVCVLASQKSLPKISQGKGTEKLIYKMAECEIL